MRRLLIDGPAAGKIVEFNGLMPLRMAVAPEFNVHEPPENPFDTLDIEYALYWPFNVFDPGDELTGRAPGILNVAVWEESPRFREYRQRAERPHREPPPVHPNCRSVSAFEKQAKLMAAYGASSETITGRPRRTGPCPDCGVREGEIHKTGCSHLESAGHEPERRGTVPKPGTDFDTLRHTEPGQNEDGTITGPDGKKRFL